MAASLMVQGSSVACRPPPGTSGSPPRATHRPRSPRPRSTDLPRSPPRTAAGSHVEPRLVGQATAVTQLVVLDPSAVSQPSSQPPPSRCCDDPLNPSSIPRSAGPAMTLPAPGTQPRNRKIQKNYRHVTLRQSINLHDKG